MNEIITSLDMSMNSFQNKMMEKNSNNNNNTSIKHSINCKNNKKLSSFLIKDILGVQQQNQQSKLLHHNAQPPPSPPSPPQPAAVSENEKNALIAISKSKLLSPAAQDTCRARITTSEVSPAPQEPGHASPLSFSQEQIRLLYQSRSPTEPAVFNNNNNNNNNKDNNNKTVADHFDNKAGNIDIDTDNNTPPTPTLFPSSRHHHHHHYTNHSNVFNHHNQIKTTAHCNSVSGVPSLSTATVPAALALCHGSNPGLHPLSHLPIFQFQGRLTSHPSQCLGFPSINPSFLPRVPPCFPTSLDPFLDTSRADNYSFPIPLPVYIRSRSPSGTDTFVKPKKCRRSRTVFTELQLMGLEKRFEGQKYLSTPDRMDLAENLGLSQIQVKTWYQNRRMKWKKQVLQKGAKESPTKPKGRPKKDSLDGGNDVDVEYDVTDDDDNDNNDDVVDDDNDDNNDDNDYDYNMDDNDHSGDDSRYSDYHNEMMTTTHAQSPSPSPKMSTNEKKNLINGGGKYNDVIKMCSSPHQTWPGSS